MELMPRLRKLADWVEPGARIADVGTDHGYLPVWLRMEGRVPFAVASDLRPGPLQRARETGRSYAVTGIDYRLCDGLSGISPDEVDTVVIAGMGGENIAAILSAADWVRDGRHTFLLQPMTHAEDLRIFLSENGFQITREALVEDRRTLYPVMEARVGRMTLTLGQIYGGTALSADPLGDRYLIEKIIRHQAALTGLKRSGAPSDARRIEQLRDVLTALYAQREEWRHANRSDN